MSLHPNQGPSRAGRLGEELLAHHRRKYTFRSRGRAQDAGRQAVEELFDVSAEREHPQGAVEAEAPRVTKGAGPAGRRRSCS